MNPSLSCLEVLKKLPRHDESDMLTRFHNCEDTWQDIVSNKIVKIINFIVVLNELWLWLNKRMAGIQNVMFDDCGPI